MALEAREVNRLELIHPVQHVYHYHHQSKMNQWKDILVKRVRGNVKEFVVHQEARKHQDLEVRKIIINIKV